MTHTQQSNETTSIAKKRALPWLLAAAVSAMVLAQTLSMQNRASAGKTTTASPRRITHILHGSTPTMAWSPNSQRLVVNSAYEYFGFDREILHHLSDLGLYVISVRNGKVEHIIDRQAYHPFWIDDDTVGWGHSPYEKGPAGIFFHRMSSAKNILLQVGSVRGVYNTAMGNPKLPSTKGKVLFWNGFPDGNDKWMLADPKMGTVTPAPAVHGQPDSWQVPRPLAQNQCLQKVGKTSVKIVSGRVRLTVGRKNRTLPGRALFYSNGQCSAAGRRCSNYIKPCLSPDGRWVAYFTAGAPRPRNRIAAGPPTPGRIPIRLTVVRTQP